MSNPDTKTLGLIHTSATLVPLFQQLCAAHLPRVEVFNMVDDSLIKDVIRQGELTDGTARRVVALIGLAADAGADHILVTCSSIGPAAESARARVAVPVLRVDQPMAEKAVQMANKIGIVATLSTTLAPTADLVRRQAANAGKAIDLTVRLCEGAFDALMDGDSAAHDAMIGAALANLYDDVEVILLAQASMARVVNELPASDRGAPILSSPPLAVEYLARLLG